MLQHFNWYHTGPVSCQACVALFMPLICFKRQSQSTFQLDMFPAKPDLRLDRWPKFITPASLLSGGALKSFNPTSSLLDTRCLGVPALLVAPDACPATGSPLLLAAGASFCFFGVAAAEELPESLRLDLLGIG